MSSPRLETGLVRLSKAKDLFLAASDRAAREVRSCADCDARCCKVGFNSMRVSRIEAEALARRLAEPDLAPLVPEILRRAEEEIVRRGLDGDPDAKFDCPLLDDEGRCRVHGPAQPAGCLTFRPVADGGCDHDRKTWDRHHAKIETAEKAAYGRVATPLPIPVALTRTVPGHFFPRRG